MDLCIFRWQLKILKEESKIWKRQSLNDDILVLAMIEKVLPWPEASQQLHRRVPAWKKELLSNTDHKIEQIFWNIDYSIVCSFTNLEFFPLFALPDFRALSFFSFTLNGIRDFIVFLPARQLSLWYHVWPGVNKKPIFKNCLVWILEMSKLLRFTPMFDCQWWCFVG